MPDARCHHCANGRCTLPAAIAVLGDSPSAGACSLCERYDGPCRGLGDRIAAVASITGIAAVARTVERVTARPAAARRGALRSIERCPKLEFKSNSEHRYGFLAVCREALREVRANIAPRLLFEDLTLADTRGALKGA